MNKILSFIGSFLKKNKGSVSLFVITLIVTLVTAAITSLFGVFLLTKIVLSTTVGIITLMGISTLEELVGMKLSNSKRPAILGIIVGVWIILL